MPLDFAGQIVKSPQVLFHLLLVVAIFPLPHPRAVRFLRSDRQISKSPISYLLLEVAIFPVPRPCAIRFPRSNRQISKSPISAAFSGSYFSLAAPMWHQISQVKSSNLHKSYISSAFSRCYFSLVAPCAARFPKSNPHKSYLICFVVVAIQLFFHFTLFSCCVSHYVSPLCLPGAAFATADRPDRSEQ